MTYKTIEKCPFCGYLKTSIEEFDCINHTEYAVMCKNCGAYGPNDLGKSGAVKQWDIRRDEYHKSCDCCDTWPPVASGACPNCSQPIT